MCDSRPPLLSFDQSGLRTSQNPLDGVQLRMRDLQFNNQIERERAELLTRATVAEQQSREQQEYIDTHLTRYDLLSRLQIRQW